jgi:hypothetical protein
VKPELTPAVDGAACPDLPPDDAQRTSVLVEKYTWLEHGHLMRQIRDKKICAWRIGGRWYVSESDLLAFVASGRNV